MSGPMIAWMTQLAVIAQLPVPGGPGQAPEPVPLPHPEIAPPAALAGRLPLWVTVSTAIFVLALVALVLWLLFRSKPATPPPLKLPHKTALKALRMLRDQAGGLPPPEIGHRVSEILRGYFMARYSVPAPFRTTQEIFSHVEGGDNRCEWHGQFGPLAAIYDEIAFAPQPFTHAQTQSLIENAITKMEEERP